MKKLLLLATVLAYFVLPNLAKSQDLTSTGFVYPLGRATWNHADGWWLARDKKHGGHYFDGSYHIGEDMMAAEGSPVYAVAEGDIAVVYTTSANASVDKKSWFIGPGNSVMFIRNHLANGSEFLSMYMHVRPTVRSGHVSAGQVIAKVGPWYYGSHLHFGIVPGSRWPTTHMGIMPNSAWDSSNRQNGFVDPVEWIRTQQPRLGASKSVPRKETPIRSAPAKPIETARLEKFRVDIVVYPGNTVGQGATVTLYGRENYYRSLTVGKGNSLTLPDVPGGRGVKIRIDVRLRNGKHHSFYEQEIYGPNHHVQFTYRPN